MTDRVAAAVSVRFHRGVDDTARNDLDVALRTEDLTTAAGPDLDDHQLDSEFVLAAISVADVLGSTITRIVSTARDWLITKPRTALDGSRTCVQFEERATGAKARITADVPDKAIGLLRSSLAGAAGTVITWRDVSWGARWSPARPGTGRSQRDRTVFVVHGRDKSARRGVYEFLRAIGLHPIEWSEMLGATGHGSPHIGDVLYMVMNAGRAVVVLSTPDDIAYLKQEHADDADDADLVPCGQARPNVLFEAGMALALFPDRTILVELGKVRQFTDLGGRHVVKLNDTFERRKLLAQRLKDIGCPVNLDGTDWLNAGDLTPPTTILTSPPAPQPLLQEAVRTNGNGGDKRLILSNHSVNRENTVYGEAYNDGSAPVSAMLKATFFGEGRKILGAAVGWVNDLAPRQTKTFTLMTDDDVTGYVDVKVEIDLLLP